MYRSQLAKWLVWCQSEEGNKLGSPFMTSVMDDINHERRTNTGNDDTLPICQSSVQSIRGW